MTAAIYVLVHCLLLFIRVADFAMLARMIVNILFMGEQTRIGSFLYVVTEPFIMPIRTLCNRLGLFQGLPMDMPFFLTAVLLMLLSIILPEFLL